MKRLFVPALGAGMLLTGCASSRVETAPGMVAPQQTTLPAPTRVDMQVDSRTYYIGPLDKLKIDVVGLPDIGGDVQVDSSGRISIPIGGTLVAAGKTPGELEALIVQRLRAGYVRDPRVAVNVVEILSQTVTVDGEVVQPGEYPATGKMTLIRAVAAARGTTEYAKENQVVLFRTVNGQDMAALYDLRAIRKGLYPDPEVYPNDKVVVGNSRARRLFKDIIPLAGVLTTPLILLLQRR